MNLSNNLINDHSIYSLRGILGHNQLRSLDLSNNNFSHEGFKLILDKLITCKSLRSLNLSSDLETVKKVTLDVQGAHLLGHLIDRCDRLVRLVLGNNDFGPQGAGVLAEVLRNNESLKELYLRQSDVDYDTLKTLLGGNRSLRKLSLSSNSIQDDTSLFFTKFLTQNLCLEALDISNNFLTKNFCVSLASDLDPPENLRMFNIANNHIETAGLRALHPILISQTLTNLNLSFNMIDENGLDFLLKTLKISNSRVRWLNLSGNEFTLKCLQSFNLWLDSLSEKEPIRYLGLGDCGVDDNLILELLRKLNEQPVILKLNLCQNLVTESFANEILYLLKQNRALQYLNLNKNRMFKLTEEKLKRVLREKHLKRLKREPLKYQLKIQKLRFDKKIIEDNKKGITRLKSQVAKIEEKIGTNKIDLRNFLDNEEVGFGSEFLEMG